MGGFVALVLATRKRLASDFGLGVALFGVPLALIAVFDSTPVALAGLAVIGLGNSLVDISAITIIQRTVPDAVLGRALGALDAILLGSIGLGAILTPLLIHVAGLRATLIGVGVLLPVLVILTATTLRSLDRRASAPLHLALLRAVDIFEPVPRINQDERAFQHSPPAQIVVHKAPPTLHQILGRLGEAVSGHVDQPQLQRPADVEDIEFLRPARCVRRARQALAVGERVQKRALADIGPPRERDFRDVGIGQEFELGRGLQEFDRPGEQLARPLLEIIDRSFAHV